MRTYSTLIFTLILVGGTALTSLSTSILPSQAREFNYQSANAVANGDQQKRQGNFDKALAYYKEAISLDPNNLAAYNQLGLCYLVKKAYPDAELAFRASLKLDPSYFPSLNNLGTSLYYQKKYDQAIFYYEQALGASEGKDADVELNLANALRDNGDYIAAIEHYRQAIRLDPGSPKAYNNLGASLYKLKRYNEALVEIKKSLHLKPDYASAYYNLGLVYKDINCNPQAIEAFNNCLKYGPRSEAAPEAQRILKMLAQAGSSQPAGTLLGRPSSQVRNPAIPQSMVNNPAFNDPVLLNNAGLALYKEQKYELARQLFDEALKQSRVAMPQAHYNLAQCQRQLGDLDGAEKSLKKAIDERQGNYAVARNTLGLVLKQKGNLAEAIKQYRLAIHDSKDKLPVAHYNLAISLQKQAKPAEAALEFKRYLTAAPNGFNAPQAKDYLKKVGVTVP